MTALVAPKNVIVGKDMAHPVSFNNSQPLAIIAGPCVLESRDHALFMAESLKKIAEKLALPLIYKTSFDKANRTSGKGYRGIGLDESLPIFQEIRETFSLPVITDIHSPEQCPVVAQVVDVLQIPALLCRQTDLLEAAAKTGKPINIKKGQFLAPWDMINVVKKMEAFDHTDFMLCERGVSFGYNTLVSDMRSVTVLKSMAYPTIFDATHSVQQPAAAGHKSGGQREFVPTLCKAAAGVGVAGIFLETHQDPDHAPSDGPNMVPLSQLESLLDVIKDYDALAKSPKSQNLQAL